MDRPEQDANGTFERGIFSGTAEEKEEKEEKEQDIGADRYFDYANCQPGKSGSSFWGQEDAVQDADRQQSENSRPGYEQGQNDGGKQSAYQNSRSYREENAWRENYDWQKEEARNGGMPFCHHDYEGHGYGSYKCRYCPKNKKMSHTALIFMLLAVIAVFAVAITIAFLVTVFCLVKVSSGQTGQPAESSISGEEADPYMKNPSKGNFEGVYGDLPVPGKGNNGEYYGEIADAIRTDLDYSIEWENYEYEGEDNTVVIAVDYPVIKGNIPNLEAINDIIDDETEYFEDYYKEYSKYMMPEERFLVYSEGYVTYMDQEVMSIVFCEMIYTDYWADYGLYCLNIDVENGIVLDNNSIMEIDDEFAVDFRKRCSQQNGAVSDLDYMSDQEIVYYLTSGGTSILFYTPMGMEVGMNFGEYYVTVTYRDYEKFLQKY